MEQLSDKERTLLAYIKERLADQIPPTVREICRDLQIKSTSSAHRYLKSLEAKGYISMGDNENRNGSRRYRCSAPSPRDSRSSRLRRSPIIFPLRLPGRIPPTFSH